MSQARNSIEEEVDSNGLVLSMRTKMVLGGLCFFLILGSMIYWSVPNAVEALRGLGQGEPLDENETQPEEEDDLNESAKEYLTVWFDDFLDDPNDPLEERDEPRWCGVCYRGELEHDGFYFLAGSENVLFPTGLHTGREFLYEGLEVRLRLSEENRNKMVKFWGFGTPWGSSTSESALIFAFYPPEADPTYQGFWAESHVNGVYALREELTRIDITEWHTYTILWEPNEATFLIDGEVIATTNSAPNIPVRLYIKDWQVPVVRCEDHLVPKGPRNWGVEGVVDESFPIQVDYVHVFTTEGMLMEISTRAEEMIAEMRDLLPPEKEHNVTAAFTKASEARMNQDFNSTLTYLWQVIWTCEMPELIQQAEDALRAMESMGYDITNATDGYEGVVQKWWSGLPRYGFSDSYTLRNIIAWHDVVYNDLFARAQESIKTAQKRGEDTHHLECFYSAAQDHWRWETGNSAYNYNAFRAKTYLDMILIPEPGLLPWV